MRPITQTNESSARRCGRLRGGGVLLSSAGRVATGGHATVCRRRPFAVFCCWPWGWGRFGQWLGFDFVNYDDGGGVYGNRLVTVGLSPHGVWAVFTERHMESWAPLTCLSHLLVWHLFGHGPAAHHLVNVLLHGALVVLLSSWSCNA